VRATASSIVSILQNFGTICGLLVEAAIYEETGNHWHAITYVAIPGFICAGMVWLLPESAFTHLFESDKEGDGNQLQLKDTKEEDVPPDSVIGSEDL